MKSAPHEPLPSPEGWRARLDAATAGLDPVFAVLDLDAFERNADDLVRRAGGLPVRVASKSVRVRPLLRAALDRPGYAGVLAFTLPEALWLVADDDAGGWTGLADVLVGYPSADRAALRRLVADPRARERVTLMVDDLAQLSLLPDLDDVPAGHEVRVCLELDASWRPAPRMHLGVRRSPLHDPEQVADLAAALARRPGIRVVGVMAYEAQTAGLGDAPPGRAAYGAVVRQVQARSAAELAGRRRAAVRAVEAELAAAGEPPLELVNGGGTGSLERTAAEGVCTEVAAGSGLLGPTLFDAYRAFRPTPAMAYATPVVRRPAPRTVTVLGGGYVASGPAQDDRLPTPWLPPGLRLSGTEGAGEVQTPLTGGVADTLAVGDRVWWRHAKAGEACERFDRVVLLRGVTGPGEPRTVGEAPTYRGEGRTFL